MSFNSTVFFLLLAITLSMASSGLSIRDFLVPTKTPTLDLATRLQFNDNSNTTDCWTALSEIRSCSNEIIGFFLNGYADIDVPCCNAVEVISHYCWPSMLGVLGFTTEEGDVLAGYCDKSVGAPPA